MQGKSFGARVALLFAEDDTPSAPSSPRPSEWATPPKATSISWPTGAKQVPVTGELSPHAAAALRRMGITK